MQPRNLDLNQVVTSLAKLLQRIIGEDIRMELHLDSKPLWTHADAGMIDQVLMNLAVNARDAMQGGGKLLVRTGEKLVDKDMAIAHPDAVPGRYVALGVTDTGAGIPPEVLPRIFEPFFTTKEAGKGTGLGLATVFGIVKQHRGWLAIYTELGIGTTFQVFLPAAGVTESDEGVRRTKPRRGTETILLAEDETPVRLLTRKILERHGYSVLDAANGPDCLQLWKQSLDSVDLLLTDLVMPEGISGYDLARKLRADRSQLKVIYASGYSADIAGRSLDLSNGERFLQKPYSPDELLETVRACLDS